MLGDSNHHYQLRKYCSHTFASYQDTGAPGDQETVMLNYHVDPVYVLTVENTSFISLGA